MYVILERIRRFLLWVLPARRVQQPGWPPGAQVWKARTDDEGVIEVPFDPATQALYCAWCGRRCEVLGHMMSTFLMCPVHGEFTWAPVVIRKPGPEYEAWLEATLAGEDAGPQPPEGGTWVMVLHASKEHMMWDNARVIDALPNPGPHAGRTG